MKKSLFSLADRRDSHIYTLAAEMLQDPQKRLLANGIVRTFCRAGVPQAQADAVMRSLVPSSGTLGSQLLPIDVSRDVLNLTDRYGAYKDLGVTPMSSMFTKFPQVTTSPKAYWITPNSIGGTLPTDTQLSGSGLTPEANTLSCMPIISNELLQDEKADLSPVLYIACAQGLATAFDTASFVGTGADDQTNGLQTGIFVDNSIASVSAAQGNSTVASLQRSDFVSCIKAVSRAALQRPCRWFISSSFIAPMLDLVDGQAKEHLLKTPAQSGDGQWYLLGFPVSWSAACPSVDAPGAKVAAFGAGDSYMVAMREELEIMLSGQGALFSINASYFRVLARAFCQTRNAAGLATLALAAN